MQLITLKSRYYKRRSGNISFKLIASTGAYRVEGYTGHVLKVANKTRG